jgi:hypothetical protein
MDTGVIVVLTLLVILYFAFEYSTLRAKYDKLFTWYSVIGVTNPNNTPSIGPMRIALSYERPWLSRLMTRPISQEMAEFMLRLIQQEHINASYLVYGPGAFASNPDEALAALGALCQSETAWNDPKNNPLGPSSEDYPGNGGIPYDSALVCGYRFQILAPKGSCGTNIVQGDLSLATLWMHGYEEYVRQRFTSAATSVLQEWNFMFAEDTAPPIPTSDACSAASFASGGIQAGIGAAALGAMMAPEAAPVGAVIGFIVGAASSLLTKTKCF